MKGGIEREKIKHDCGRTLEFLTTSGQVIEGPEICPFCGDLISLDDVVREITERRVGDCKNSGRLR